MAKAKKSRKAPKAKKTQTAVAARKKTAKKGKESTKKSAKRIVKKTAKKKAAKKILEKEKLGDGIMNIADIMFETGVAISRNCCMVIGENEGERFSRNSRFCLYKADRSPLWQCFQLEAIIASSAVFRNKTDDMTFAALDEEGVVYLMPMNGEADSERLPGAGVGFDDAGFDDADGRGMMNRLVSSDDVLYACGCGGQIFQRVAPGSWIHCDDGLLEDPLDSESQDITIEALGCRNGKLLYAGGWIDDLTDGFIAKNNGGKWTIIVRGVHEINDIHIAKNGTVWACGGDGTLLRSTDGETFTDVSGIHDNEFLSVADEQCEGTDGNQFLSVAEYHGVIYLATDEGLRAFDGKRISPVDMGLDPDYAGGNVLQVVDDHLWSFGHRDIARFDGERWERIAFPGNEQSGDES